MSYQELVEFAQQAFPLGPPLQREDLEGLRWPEPEWMINVFGDRPYPDEHPNSFIENLGNPRRPVLVEVLDPDHSFIITGLEGGGSSQAASASSPTAASAPGMLTGSGIDALAHYRPFHFYDTWGIFIAESSVHYLAEQLKGAPLTNGDGAWADAAYAALLHHEVGHFMTELAATCGEVATLREWYRPFFPDRRALEIEEAMCHAWALWSMRGERFHIAKKKLVDWLKASGIPGHAHFESFLGKRRQGDLAIRDAWVALVEAMQSAAKIGSTATASPLHHAAFPGDKLFDSAKSKNEKPADFVPTYYVRDVKAPILKRAWVMEDHRQKLKFIVRTEDHTPVHFHLIDRARTDKELQRHLKNPPRYKWLDLEPTGRKAEVDSWRLTSGRRRDILKSLGKHGKRIREQLEKTYRSRFRDPSLRKAEFDNGPWAKRGWPLSLPDMPEI